MGHFAEPITPSRAAPDAVAASQRGKTGELHERQTPAIRKLTEDRLALKAMRERVDGGRPGTWLASGEFVEADQ
jgi:hypothetical protein